MAYNALDHHDTELDSNDDGEGDVRSPSLKAQTTAGFPAITSYSELASIEHDEMESPITRSREGSIPMRHPTPDLQSLQGAYVGNIERLEQSAERLSLSSSEIGEEIRKIGIEQRRSESRRSSTQNWYRSEGVSSPVSQRQISLGQTSHASNSIVETNNVARSGGFSPAGYFASPRGSIRSGSWSHHNSVKERSVSQGARLTQLTEPEQEARYLESPLSASFAPSTPPSGSAMETRPPIDQGPFNLDDVEIPAMQSVKSEPDVAPVNETEHPRTSTDTYRQAGADGLFSDFDGIHTDPLPDDVPTANGKPAPPRRASRVLEVMPHSEDMVFYPAPVPMMLNIPTRLSKQPQAPPIEKRRSELLGGLSSEARKSAAWLPKMHEDDQEHLSNGHEARRRTQIREPQKLADLPPQLRASMFFDYPSTRHDIQVTGQSAVSTLDSILDAATFAPVSAFTDHPIVGQMGPEAYGRPAIRPRTSTLPVEIAEMSKRRGSLNLLRKRNSSADLLSTTGKRNSSILSLGNFGRRKSSGPAFEDAQEHLKAENHDLHLQTASPPYHGAIDPDFEHGDDVEQDTDIIEQLKEGIPEGGYSSQPSTLLAELQLRKEELKGRTRTAATAFPDGMHSTLLQLDTVAHMQKQARKQKHTHLAWEDPTALHSGLENEDDEDVPLGMLYTGRQMDNREKARLLDEDRPLGLIARREMEDNEPLSHRRARLRGEDISVVGDNSTQGQRINTIDFPPDLQAQQNPAEEDDEHANETLAERARRLKATKIPTQPRPVSGDFASEMMSQIGGLSAAEQPAATEQATDRVSTKTPDLGAAEETMGERRHRLQAAATTSQALEANAAVPKRRSMADILQVHPAAGAGVRNMHNEVKYTPGPRTRNTTWAQNVNRQAGLAIGVNAGYRYQSGQTRVNPAINRLDYMQDLPPLDQGNARQNDMVDRWRQSIMYGVQ